MDAEYGMRNAGCGSGKRAVKIAKQSVAHLSPSRTHYRFVSAPAKLNSQVPDVYIFDILGVNRIFHSIHNIL